MDKKTFQKIKKLLAFVWQSKKSDFYRKKYREAGFKNLPSEIKTPEDFQKLPFLTREQLAASSPFDRLYFDRFRMAELSSTSGTTLRKPVLTLRQLLLSSDEDSRTEEHSVFKYGSRILFLNQPMRVASRLLDILDKQRKLPKTLVAGDPYNLAGTAYLAGKAGIDAINAPFSLTIAFAEHLEKHYDRAKIKFLGLGGELITGPRAEVLKRLYPKAKLHAIYGMSEARALGFLYGFTSAKEPLYHTNPRIFYETVTDELVVTSSGRDDLGTPLIRYKTGDAVKWAGNERQCVCGRKSKLFRILGRVDYDFVRLAGGELREEAVEKVLSAIPVIRDLKVHVLEQKSGSLVRPKVIFEVALYYEVADISELADKIASLIPVSGRLTLKDAVKEGVVLPLEIKIVSELSSPQNRQNRIIFHHPER